MEKFVPQKKNEFAAAIKKYLMGGFIIRYDGIEENPLEWALRQTKKIAS
jgi:hypothetical protein